MRYLVPDVFDFNDYREFLKAFFAENKKAFPHEVTHERICRDLGQTSRSFFNNVVVGRRDLTDTFISRFIELMGLEGNERDYFRNLVKFNQARDLDEKQYYYKQIVMLGTTPRQIMAKKKYRYYSEWYHAAIRSLLDIIDFTDDYEHLAGRLFPPITPTKAKKSIRLLLELGLIAPDERGCYKPTHTVLSTGPGVRDFLVKKYQLECLENLQKVIFKNDLPNHNYGATFSISDQGLEQLLDRLQQFETELRTIVSKDSHTPTQLFRINLNLFLQAR